MFSSLVLVRFGFEARYIVCPGNHEYYFEHFVPYVKLFQPPSSRPIAWGSKDIAHESHFTFWHSVDIRDVHIASISTEHDYNEGPTRNAPCGIARHPRLSAWPSMPFSTPEPVVLCAIHVLRLSAAPGISLSMPLTADACYPVAGR